MSEIEWDADDLEDLYETAKESLVKYLGKHEDQYEIFFDGINAEYVSGNFKVTETTGVLYQESVSFVWGRCKMPIKDKTIEASGTLTLDYRDFKNDPIIQIVFSLSVDGNFQEKERYNILERNQYVVADYSISEDDWQFYYIKKGGNKS